MYSTNDEEEGGFDLIVGSFLKCPKGRWLLDDVEIKTGEDGVRATLLMNTAQHGCVYFDKGGEKARPIVTDLRRYADCDPSREALPNGLDPYTIFQCLIGEELCTFAASSWGARKSFKKLVDTWRIVHPREFPIVTLGTRPTGDANDNIAPAFKPVAWVPIDSFSSMLSDAAEAPQPLAPPTAAAPAAPLPRPSPLQIVTSGRAAPASADTPTAWAKPEAPKAPAPAKASEDEDDYPADYGGGPIDDDIRF
jgi:hypothetical protein